MLLTAVVARREAVAPPGTAELEAVAVVLALVAGGLGIARWRATGLAPPLLTGIGVALYGVGAVGLGMLTPPLSAGATASMLAWLRPMTLIASVGVLAWAALVPDVDARLRARFALALPVAAVAASAVALQALMGPAGVVAPGIWMDPTGRAIAAVAWATLGAAYTVRAARDRRALFAWYGLMLHGLALGEVMDVVATVGGDVWAFGAATVRVGALQCAVAVGIRELQWMFAQQGRRLLQTTTATLASEARMENELARQAERAHEARNALTSIEGATLTLERYHDQLDPTTRESLSRAMIGEISRLQRLVGGQDHTGYRIRFRLVDITEPQITLARGQGAHVLSDVPDDLTAFGRPADIAEVVQNLLVNAQRHAPDSPIIVRAAREGDRVLLRVEDRGPGVPHSVRRSMFERGTRGPDSGGSGLGLYVSAQLITDMGGQLTLEDRDGPGACFALALPADNEVAATSANVASGQAAEG